MSEFVTPSKIFRDSVVQDFTEGVVKGLISSCQRAKRHCFRNFQKPEALDLFGHYRRACFENTLKELSGTIPGCSARTERNASGTSSYTRVTCGRVQLTAAHLAGPNQIVREANFRTTLARDSQMSLFGEETKPEEEAMLYGLIIYGFPSINKLFPDFVQIVFPNASCTSYLDRIDLLREHSSLVNKLIDDPHEEVGRPKFNFTEKRKKTGKRMQG